MADHLALLDDVAVDEKPTRLGNRKREGMLARHKYRFSYMLNGTMTKVVYVVKDGMMSVDLTQPSAVDFAGIPCVSTLYSLGKCRRWELPDRIAQEMPEPDPSIASTSVLRLSYPRVGNPYEFQLFHGMACPLTAAFHNSHVTRITSRSINEVIEREGKYSRRLNLLEHSDPQPKASSVHVQYQFLDYTYSKKYTDSDRNAIVLHYSRRRRGPPFPLEGFRLGRDVWKDGEGRWITDDDKGNQELICCPIDVVEETAHDNYVPRPTITLEDFIPLQIYWIDTNSSQRQKRRRRRQASSNDWEIL